jgi:hypothetical protein
VRGLEMSINAGWMPNSVTILDGQDFQCNDKHTNNNTIHVDKNCW